MAGAMPVEGTLMTELTAFELIKSNREMADAVRELTRAITAPNRGLAAKLAALDSTLDTIFDPEKAIVARAAVFASIDRTLDAVIGRVVDLGQKLQELAAHKAAAPATPAES